MEYDKNSQIHYSQNRVQTNYSYKIKGIRGKKKHIVKEMHIPRISIHMKEPLETF